MKKSTQSYLIDDLNCIIVDIDSAHYFLQNLLSLNISLTEDETLMKEVIEESIEGIPSWAGITLYGDGLNTVKLPKNFFDNFFDELGGIREGLLISLELRGVI